MPYALLYSLLTSTKKKIILCITVDADLRKSPCHKKTRDMELSIKYTLDLLKKCGLESRATWFINEEDYKWTKNFLHIQEKVEKKAYYWQIFGIR